MEYKINIQNIKAILKTAIEQQLELELYFKKDPLPRLIHPYHFGHYGSSGRLHLHAFQVQGPSRSKQNIGWKHFALADIKKLRIIEQRFAATDKDQNGNGYNPAAPYYRVEFGMGFSKD